MPRYCLFFENKKTPLLPGRSLVIGRDSDCDVVIDNAHISRRHARLDYAEEGFVLTDLASTNGTWFEGKRIETLTRHDGFSFRVADTNLFVRTDSPAEREARQTAGDTLLFEKKVAGILERVEDETVVEDIAVLRRLYNRKKENLSELAFRDPLTGLYNRRTFDDKLTEETTRALRYGRPLSLLMADIDHFKQVNDTHGHQKGDEVLAAVGGILRQAVRSADIVCRYGGEEMAVILPETDTDQACLVAELCRSRIETLSEETAGLAVTVSIGIAGLGERVKSTEALITYADKALYRAKESGRNRAVRYVK